MRCFESASLVTLAAVAAMATMAVPASATAPEFGRCVAKAGGKFEDSGCTKEKAGATKFEWMPGPGAKAKFHSVIKSGTTVTLETVGKTKFTCTGEESPGEFKNAKEVGGIVAKFNGCKTSGFACTTTGDAPEEITTHSLGGVLGVEKLGTTHVSDKLALELHSESGNFAEYSCAGLPSILKGSVLHPVTANKMLLTATEKFAATAGEQKPDKFAGEGEDAHILESNTNGGPFEEFAFTVTEIWTFEEHIEASSVN